MNCSCVVCRRHAEVHAQASIETVSGPASVDSEMEGLVSALTTRGFVTVASCIDLREAVDELAPHWLPELTKVSLSSQSTLNYQAVLTSRLTFVRLLAGATDRLKMTTRLVGGQVLDEWPLVQLAFPRHAIPQMLECLR